MTVALSYVKQWLQHLEGRFFFTNKVWITHLHHSHFCHKLTSHHVHLYHTQTWFTPSAFVCIINAQLSYWPKSCCIFYSLTSGNLKSGWNTIQNWKISQFSHQSTHFHTLLWWIPWTGHKREIFRGIKNVWKKAVMRFIVTKILEYETIKSISVTRA